MVRFSHLLLDALPDLAPLPSASTNRFDCVDPRSGFASLSILTFPRNRVGPESPAKHAVDSVRLAFFHLKGRLSMPVLELLGDQGVLARCQDEAEALAWADSVRRLRASWLLDVVQAYTTVAVFLDPQQHSAREVLQQLAQLKSDRKDRCNGNLHLIPCCYDLGLDLERIQRHTGLTLQEVIHLHSSTVFTVFAIGFCPGFPYLGYLPEPLCGVPRLDTPRIRVEPGSVGLTGRQTGIYTETRPGGWNLVGRTPLQLVNVAAGYFPLRTGDRVRFVPITQTEFGRLIGHRLEDVTSLLHRNG